MRLQLVCVGRAKAGPLRDLAARYIKRAAAVGGATGFAGIELREVEESRAARADDRKREEAKALRGLLGARCHVIGLDESGEQLTSKTFAAKLSRARDEGIASLALVIGGPDGLDPEFLASAWLKLSFGAMTWPHQLVRIMAAEQIYRAVTIASGHPYHRD
jgi:23S rRNA (pseudouridine1915-N3)-methyltransferase